MKKDKLEFKLPAKPEPKDIIQFHNLSERGNFVYDGVGIPKFELDERGMWEVCASPMKMGIIEAAKKFGVINHDPFGRNLMSDADKKTTMDDMVVFGNSYSRAYTDESGSPKIDYVNIDDVQKRHAVAADDIRKDTILSYDKQPGIWKWLRKAMKRRPSTLEFRKQCPPYKKFRPTSVFYWTEFAKGPKGKFIDKPRVLFNNPTILFKRKGSRVNSDGSITVFLDKSAYGKY